MELRGCPVCASAVPVDNAFCGACGSRMPVTDAAQGADALIGRVIDSRFRVLRLIGTGGMGTVYLAEHVGIGKRVAIKVLRADLRSHPDLVSRFRREAMAVSKLADPHSITVFDFGMWKGLVYLVMEYLRGADLATILEREGRLDAGRALEVVLQVCSSLAEAHEQGVVHRDLKPENIFVTRAAGGAELIKVLDFGLAKLMSVGTDDTGFQTREGALLGTPYLMAPEQIRGEAVDGRCDLYSLGALLFRMLTGRYPYRDRSPMRILEAHLAGLVPPFEAAAPGLAPMAAVESLVRQLMQVDASRRPASALAVIEDIRALRAGLRLPNPAPLLALTPPPELGEPLSRSRSGAPEAPTRALGAHAEPAPTEGADEPAQPSRLATEVGGHSPPAAIAATTPPDSEVPPLAAATADEAREAAPADWIEAVPSASLPGFEAPTRDEFRAWERSLRLRARLRWAGVFALVAALAGLAVWSMLRPPPAAPAMEQEPNDEPATATPIDLGRAIGGHIGPQRGADRPDRDVFVLSLPEGPGALTLEVTGVPGVDLIVEGFDAEGGRSFVLNGGGPGQAERAEGIAFSGRRLYVGVRAVWVHGEPPTENTEVPYALTVRRAPAPP